MCTLGAISLITNSVSALYIDSSGNTGIGTAAPSYKLDISGDTRIVEGLYLDFLTYTGETVLIASGNSVDNNEIGDYDFIDLTVGNLLTGITTTTFTINETTEYDEIIYHVSTGCTIVIDTDQLARSSILNIKCVDVDVIVETEGGEIIDGETSQTLYQYDSIRLSSYDGKWNII